MSQVAFSQHEEKPDVFMYEDLCHDLKTPLSIVYAYLQLLERMSGMPSRAGLYLTEAKKNCLRMAKQLRDANDGARLSKGMMLPRFINCDIVALVREICDNAAVLTRSKNINIYFTSRPPEKIMAVDRTILERILLNLLANARQHSHEGGEIQVDLWEEGENLHIAVRDYGTGISPERADTVFKRYAGETGQGSHSGLGLYIVRELAVLLGGDVYLTQAVPGVEIVIRLPVLITEDGTEERPADDFFADNMVQMELSF